MDEFRLARPLRTELDVGAARLERLGIAAGRDLAVGLLARQPDLDIVCLCGREPHVSGTQQHRPVRQLEPLQDLFGVGGQRLQLLVRLIGRGELDELDLVELMLPDQSANIGSVGSRFAAKARRVGGVAKRSAAGRRESLRNGDGTFTDVTFSSGVGINNRYVAWGCGFLDYDNDGWPDLMQINGHVYPEIEGHDIGQTFKNPRLLYKNLGNGRFKDVSDASGPGINERFSSRGAAFGDYDNDGDIDVVILNMNDLPSLLRNDGGNQQNWIKIKLIGTKCNRTAIGARVRVVTGTHAQMDEVHSGASVMSQCDLRLHFGLGKAQTVDVIEVKWPTTQKIERFTQVKANQIITVREGSGIVEVPKAK